MHVASTKNIKRTERFVMVSAATKIQPKTGPRITVSLPQHDHLALSALAERCDVSLSWLTRQAIAEFLANHGKEDLQLPLNLEKKASHQ
ncbi:ribbon-helix-helix domain-containing protein [Ensifer sp. SL37]|uniref:ribbon-helix-helix protein, CopG family n=1 Tax=Ensifer sp. SL37 TaxID=2995137 RepID=UPI000FCB3DB3